MVRPPEPKVEEQLTVFIDFLGFSEASTDTDESTVSKVLELLISLSELRAEFDVQSTLQGTGKTLPFEPAISTFSDNIVISYQLGPISTVIGNDEPFNLLIIMDHFNWLLTKIATAALHIGFLLRGGATIGKLYHAGGVVFGEALVEAFQIESRISIYPRVVLSHKITSRLTWIEQQQNITRGDDGLYHFDYFRKLALIPLLPANSYPAGVDARIKHVISTIARKLTEFERQGKLNELAKWAWFAREFRSSLEREDPKILKVAGVSLDAIPWPI